MDLNGKWSRLGFLRGVLEDALRSHVDIKFFLSFDLIPKFLQQCLYPNIALILIPHCYIIYLPLLDPKFIDLNPYVSSKFFNATSLNSIELLFSIR